MLRPRGIRQKVKAACEREKEGRGSAVDIRQKVKAACKREKERAEAHQWTEKEERACKDREG